MNTYQEQDFDQMAQAVVDRFMSGASLAESAVDEAVKNGLNTDQIARLVQAANTQAFLRLMDQQKAQNVPDMTGEFDPIDMQQIVSKLMAGTPSPEHEQIQLPYHHEEEDVPDEMSSIRSPKGEDDDEDDEDDEDDDDEDEDDEDEDENDGPFPKGRSQQAKDATARRRRNKKSSVKARSKTAGYAVQASNKDAIFKQRRLQKFASVLEDQYRQAEWSFEDGFAKLSRALRKAHGAPSMEAFEKDALALHGDGIGVVILNMVRNDRGLPKLAYDVARTKAAALVDRHVVDNSEAINMFERLVKIATEAERLQRGAIHVRSLCS